MGRRTTVRDDARPVGRVFRAMDRTPMKDQTVLLIPGLGGSSADHWQGRWASQDAGVRVVEQSDWTAPDAERWTEALDRAVVRAGGPVVLVAHSLGCALVARWVRVVQGHRYSAVMGAMLVAPADVDDGDRTPDVVRSFAPMPLQAMPFPSVVAASEDDPYVGLDRAMLFADRWGARFRNLGRCGHVNDASGLGDWPEGRAILEDLLAAAKAART
jgi:predicted alpha/beta hydrolase family esterase